MYYQEDLDYYNKKKELKRDFLKHKYKNKKQLQCVVKEFGSSKKSKDSKKIKKINKGGKKSLEISF